MRHNSCVFPVALSLALATLSPASSVASGAAIAVCFAPRKTAPPSRSARLTTPSTRSWSAPMACGADRARLRRCTDEGEARLAAIAAAPMRPKITSLKFLCRSADRPLFSPVTARKIPLSKDIRVETVKYRNALTRKDLWAMSAINFRAPPCFVCRISAVSSGGSAQVREQLGQCQAVWRSRAARARSTETSCETPRSAIVTPNSRSTHAIVMR